MVQEVKKLYEILASFLGEAKNGFDDSNFQYQFACPHCVERDGSGEARKYNLECNIQKGVFQCWKCGSIGEDMHGSITKLIKMYGNNSLLDEYKSTIRSIRDSELYKLHFNSNDFNIDTSIIQREDLKFPSSFKFFEKGKPFNKGAMRYLNERGIGWDIIERYKIGYTEREEENKKGSFRIIIPSYNSFGELNYWVGRDYLPKSDKFPRRIKYDNPKVEKKDIIFNEDKLVWDADITLVEGPFDHIVVPNSVPLLGKALNNGYKLYWELITKANANVNIWLDNDAKDTALETYKLLNHGRLYGKVRIIETNEDLGKDPSDIYQKCGYKEIARHLANAQQIPEVYLQ
jgi:hypothetical protein